MSVLRCISARDLKNTVFPSKNTVWRSKTQIFEKKVLLKKVNVFKLFPLFKGPSRVHMGPYGPIWTRKTLKDT